MKEGAALSGLLRKFGPMDGPRTVAKCLSSSRERVSAVQCVEALSVVAHVSCGTCRLLALPSVGHDVELYAVAAVDTTAQHHSSACDVPSLTETRQIS